MNDFTRRLGFWSLAPFSLPLGLWVRKTATRLPEADGERIGQSGDGERLDLLAVGDSIIAGVGTGQMQYALPVRYAKSLASACSRQVSWYIEGRNGQDISGLRDRISTLSGKQAADLILISIGVNDVTGLSTTRHWQQQLKALLEELHAGWPLAKVVFAGLPPMAQFPLLPQPLRYALGLRATVFDNIAASLIAHEDQMLHIPTRIDPTRHGFSEDGFHPSGDACQAWATEMARITREAFFNN